MTRLDSRLFLPVDNSRPALLITDACWVLNGRQLRKYFQYHLVQQHVGQLTDTQTNHVIFTSASTQHTAFNMKGVWHPLHLGVGQQIKQISPVRDWRSTLQNWRFCLVQSHATQKPGVDKYQKSGPIKFRYCALVKNRIGQLPAPNCKLAEETAFKNGMISNFQGLVTLTLGRIILHTVVHHSSTSTYVPNFIEIEETFCGRTDVCTYVCT